MKCTKCGTEFEGNFCSECGTPVAEMTQPPVQEQPVNNVSEQALQEFAPTDINYQEAPKKKSRRLPVILSICGVLVAIGVLVAVFFSNVSNLFMSTFASAKDYYKFAEGRTISQTADLVSEKYENPLDKNQKITTETKLEIGESLKSFMTSFGTGSTDEAVMSDVLSKLNSVSISGDVNIVDKKVNGNIDFRLNDKSAIDCDIYADTNTSELYAQLPKLKNGYIYMDLNKDSNDEDKSLSVFPDLDTTKKLLIKYFGVAVDNITNAEKRGDTLTVQGVSEGCTLVEMQIGEEDANNIMKGVLESLKADEEVQKIILDIAKANGSDLSKKDIIDDIQEALDSINKLTKEDLSSEEKLIYRVWTNGKGEIVARELELGDEGVLRFATAQSGSKIGCEISFKQPTSTVALEGILEKHSDCYTGTLDFKIGTDSKESYSVLKAVLNNFEYSKEKTFGTLTIKAGDDISAMGMEQSIATMLKGFEVTLSLNSNKSYSFTEVALKMNGDKLLTFTQENKSSNPDKMPSPPADYVDASDDTKMEEWLENADADALLDFYSDLGIFSFDTYQKYDPYDYDKLLGDSDSEELEKYYEDLLKDSDSEELEKYYEDLLKEYGMSDEDE